MSHSPPPALRVLQPEDSDVRFDWLVTKLKNLVSTLGETEGEGHAEDSPADYTDLFRCIKAQNGILRNPEKCRISKEINGLSI